MCGRSRPNEKFSGKGHARHICGECQRRPKEEREIRSQLCELEDRWRQTNISSKNIKWLEALCASPYPMVVDPAIAILLAAKASQKAARIRAICAEHARTRRFNLFQLSGSITVPLSPFNPNYDEAGTSPALEYFKGCPRRRQCKPF